MSTPLIDSSRFANLSASLVHYATTGRQPFGGGFSATREAGEICRAFGLDCFKVSPKEAAVAIRATVFDWQRLNYNAHVVRYESAPVIPGTRSESRPESPRPNWTRAKVLNIPALLKALQAVRYNCDNGTACGESLRGSMVTLETLIFSLKDICLEMLPAYQSAEWAI